MKIKVFLSFLAFYSIAFAAVNDTDYAENDVSTFDQTPTVKDDAPRGPFFLEFYFDCLGNARFHKKHLHHDHKERFDELGIEATMVFCYNEEYKEGVSGTVGYIRDNLRWHNNPYFNQDHYDTGTFAISGFSHRSENWDWKGSAQVNIDLNHLNLQNYTTYDFLVWGRYDAFCNVGVHTGIIALTGMKVDRVYPLFGFDWQINEDWKVTAIFPINFSIAYQYSTNLLLSVNSRFWEVRHRVGREQPLSQAIWVYRNMGAEFGGTYIWEGFKANLHVGYAFGGHLIVANKHYRHKRHLKFGGSPYVGGEFSYNF